MIGDDDLDEKIEFGGEEATLADFVGFDLSGVDAIRFQNFPEGFMIWEVMADPAPGVKVVSGKGAIVIPCKCLDILALKDTTVDPAEWIGKVHNETKMIQDVKSMGYMVATLEDFGVSTKAPVGTVLASLVGVKFKAGIKWRSDKNDKDKVYAGLVKIEVLEAASAGSEVAAALVE